MKQLGVLTLALLLVLAVVVPAHADAPVVWWDIDFEDDWPYVDCREVGYDFTIRINQFGHEKLTAFYDKDGNVLRFTSDQDGIGYLYNEYYPYDLYPANAIPNTYHFTGHHDVVSQDDVWIGVYRLTGLVFSLQMPGEGGVVHMSGQFEYTSDGYDPGMALKWVGNNTIDMPVICEALDW